ncbi:MAG: helix-turn-helix domain-containing protein [Alphaproteobacteria bacterium]|nr:helix-turn-helix domain-containing protein [Alphaproteobacteria bacterium]
MEHPATPYTPRQGRADPDPRTTGKVLRLLAEFQKIDPAFPLQYAVCLAEISLEEGLSLTALADRTGLNLSTVSRIVGALSKHRQRGAPYGLIRVVLSKEERRRKELYLTPKGRAVMAGLCAAVS